MTRILTPLESPCMLAGMAHVLYLLRHAKSSWDNPSLPDHDRPLARRGQRACATLTRHLRREHISPELVLCSSSIRTRDTLAGIERGFDRQADISIEERLYASSAEDLLARLQEVPDAVQSLMMIGHFPAIQELAVYLAVVGELRDAVTAKFPTAALATLRCTRSWKRLGPGSAELLAFVKPRELPDE
jgi:phosphohistidine phosphatase